jgi:hypothetical protein
MTILENMDDFKAHVLAVTAKALERKRIRELRADYKAAKMAAGPYAEKAKKLSGLLWEGDEPFGCRTPIVANFLSVLIDSPVKQATAVRARNDHPFTLFSAVTRGGTLAVITRIRGDDGHAHDVPQLLGSASVQEEDIGQHESWDFADPTGVEKLFAEVGIREAIARQLDFPLVV